MRADFPDRPAPGAYATQAADNLSGGVAIVDEAGLTTFAELSPEQMLQLAAGLKRTAKAIKRGKLLPAIGQVSSCQNF